MPELQVDDVRIALADYNRLLTVLLGPSVVREIELELIRHDAKTRSELYKHLERCRSLQRALETRKDETL